MSHRKAVTGPGLKDQGSSLPMEIKKILRLIIISVFHVHYFV